MLAHCPAFRATRERPPGLPACARPLAHWVPMPPLPSSQAVRAPGPPEADWPGDPANILPDWTVPVPTDGCFPGLTCTALTRWPVALRVTCRNTAISSSLVSLKSAALKSAASHSCIRWWTPRVSALPFFVSSGSTIRRSSPGYRRVIRPNLTGLFTARLIRDTLTGNTWLSWVVVQLSPSRRSRSGTSSPSDRPWDDLSSAIPLAGRLTKPATD